MEKTNKRKVLNIVEIVIGALFLVGFVLCIVLQVTSPDGDFTVWVKNNVWDISKTLQGLKNQLPEIIQCVIYIVLVFAISKILRTIFRAQINKSDRAKTVVTLLDGLVKYGCAIAIIIFVLKACGVDTDALIASVGVLTLIVGLGAQTLIADIIAGVFNIFENEFNSGETISIDGFRGKVLEIGIRSTKLIDAAGNIKIVNHSNITNVVNLSREISLAVVDCDFPYDVPIEYIENLFDKNFEGIKDRIPAIVEGPFYKGVSGYGASNVAVKLIAKCSEEDRYQVQRDLLREYRVLFVANGIDLSYDQIVVNQPEKSKITASEQIKKEADAFVEEQKTASENLEEQVRE